MRKCLAAFAIFLSTQSVGAQQIDIPLPSVPLNVSGVSVSFDGDLRLAARNSCRTIGAEIDVGLEDLAAKLTQIVIRSGVNRSSNCGDTVRVNNVGLSKSGNGLHVKVDGFVARQECVVTKVPEFRGLKVTFKNRTVTSNTFSTNASVKALFEPRVENKDTLRLVLTSGPSTNVSNDAYRFLISAFNLQGKIDNSIKGAIQNALQNDALWLRLPPEVARFGVRLEDANIIHRNGKLSMRINGAVDVPANLASTLMQQMGVAVCR